ncbi:MAG: aromatic amino acid transport family protein [Cyanobacteria bacterium J06560_2]
MKHLFSNVELEGNVLKHRPGSVLYSAALIAGTTIGAGILAVPAVTLPVGIVPSTVVMVGAWLYMVVSGLLIAEANLQAMQKTGRADLGLLATIQGSLGTKGAIASGIVYIFIHYALLVAYIARGGDILAAALENFDDWLSWMQPIPLGWGHVAFAVLFGGVLYWGSERQVSWLNSALVSVVIVAFVGLVALVVGQADFASVEVQHWEQAISVIPVMFVAFVYHNVVPVVTTQLEGNGEKVRRAIWLGALVPLVMFALWNGVILASVGQAVEALEGVDPIELLRTGTAHPWLGIAVSVFSEFAIATSFIGFVLGLLSVFEDIFSQRMVGDNLLGNNRKFFFYTLILLPPLLLSFLDPNIFYQAIDFSGAFGSSLLFGIVPALMVWRLRESLFPSVPLVGGGKVLLVGMIAISTGVVVQNILGYL